MKERHNNGRHAGSAALLRGTPLKDRPRKGHIGF
jgi:hypothetical protein